MRFDAAILCVIIAAKMMFRPSISDVRRAGMAGLVCLAAVCICRAGDEEGRLIEVVPAHSALINTNVNGSSGESRGDLDKLLRGTTRSFDPLDNAEEGRAAPYKPPQARPLTPREQEWLERRKDWVFMTPEELISEKGADELLGIKDYDKNGDEKKPAGTALERYYQHLLDSDHPTTTTTNKLRDWASDSDSPDKDTNSIVRLDQHESDYSQLPFEGTFNSRSDPGIFQPHRAESFADTFNGNTESSAQREEREEALRVEKEQKAQIEAFKQIWNLDQPAPVPVASSPTPISTAPAADPFNAVQPVLGAATPSLSASSPQQSSSSSQQTLPSERANNLPMHPPQVVNPRGPAF